MTNILRQNISTKMLRRSAGSALRLAVVFALGMVATRWAEAQTFTVLYAFKDQTDAANPYAGMVRDTAGHLYGTTFNGGGAGCYGYGCGAVFKLDTSGKEVILYSFTDSPDGSGPYAGLVRDAEGNLYGTTLSGGSAGRGTVFKVGKDGRETVLHSFGGPDDGDSPYAPLIRDAAGNLYGTTRGGKLNGYPTYGTVFKVSKTGKETVLYNFVYGAGAFPYAGLILDAADNLYGTTPSGGPGEWGTVFKLSRTGGWTLLHSFSNSDGGEPFGGVVRDAKGNLYGTTAVGGSSGLGTVFKLNRSGNETVLHNFAGYPTDGQSPYRRLVRDGAGNFYGATYYGGPSRCGTVFKLTKTGKETVLYNFSCGADGAFPYGSLALDEKGTLYGTAFGGGNYKCNGQYGCGTVWKLTP